MALTLGPASTETTIYAVVRRLTKDNTTSPSAFASDNIIKALANEGTAVIASITRSRKKTNIASPTSTVAGTRLYNKPSDCLEILKVYCNGIPLEYISFDELDIRAGQTWWTTQGTPTSYYIEDDDIGLYPIPSSVLNLITFYVTKPATLSADANVPDLDPRLHMALCYWIARRIMLERREPDIAEQLNQLFLEDIEVYKASGKDSRQPQKMLNYLSSSQGWDPAMWES